MTTRLTVLVALVLAVVLAGGCSRKSRPGEYYSEANKFSIIPPTSWEWQAGSGMVSVIFLCPVGRHSEGFRENINVVVETLPEAMSLEEYVQAATTLMAAVFRDYEQVSLTDIDLDNVKAKRLVYVYTFGDSKIHLVAYFAVRDKTGYVVTGAALSRSFPQFESTFDECARTFRVE